MYFLFSMQWQLLCTKPIFNLIENKIRTVPILISKLLPYQFDTDLIDDINWHKCSESVTFGNSCVDIVSVQFLFIYVIHFNEMKTNIQFIYTLYCVLLWSIRGTWSTKSLLHRSVVQCIICMIQNFISGLTGYVHQIWVLIFFRFKFLSQI